MKYKEILEKNDMQVVEYTNVCAIPVGRQQIICLYDEEGNYIPNTSKRTYGKSEYYKPDTPHTYDMDKIEYVDEEVVFLGFLRGHWGHFIVDGSVRLWALTLQKYKGKKVLARIEGNATFCKILLKHLGIEENQILQIDVPTRFKKVHVPDISYVPFTYISKKFLAPYRTIAEQINLEKEVFEKIYLSREHFAKGKKELGEKYIRQIFEDNGYHILYPEELSFEEQVWYYKNCKEIVTTNGTVSHNVVYANEGIRLVLLKRFDDTNLHQLAINQINNIEFIEVDCFEKGSERDKCLMLQTKELEEFCKDNSMIYGKQKMWRKICLKLVFRIPYLYKVFG